MKKPVKMIIRSEYNLTLNEMKDKYLTKDSYNVFLVNWNVDDIDNCFLHNGKELSELINHLKPHIGSNRIEMIGIGYGSHFAGYVANNVNLQFGIKIKIIYALEPTSPTYYELKYSDAEFVESLQFTYRIHEPIKCKDTFPSLMAHASFYYFTINPYTCFTNDKKCMQELTTKIFTDTIYSASNIKPHVCAEGVSRAATCTFDSKDILYNKLLTNEPFYVGEEEPAKKKARKKEMNWTWMYFTVNENNMSQIVRSDIIKHLG